MKKKSWKDHLESLCEQLPAVGIDPKNLQEAMKRLPPELLTSETYCKLSSTAKQGIVNISVGLMMLDRDLETLRRAGGASESWEGILMEVENVLKPLYKKAYKSFCTWEKKSYPHGKG